MRPEFGPLTGVPIIWTRMVAYGLQRDTISGMREAVTIGFSIRGQRDQERLSRLTAVFGNGNRSEFLRRALDIMERKELADRLLSLQVRGQAAAKARGIASGDSAALVEKYLASTATSGGGDVSSRHGETPLPPLADPHTVTDGLVDGDVSFDLAKSVLHDVTSVQ